MGNVSGHLPVKGTFNSQRGKRKNQQLAKRPEELIVKLPVNDESDDVLFLVNTNPHVSGRDTLKPYRDAEHPAGLFTSLSEALERAKKVFATQQKLRDAHATALGDTVMFTNKPAGR